MYKNKINVTNKTNSSELVSPYIGFLSIFCTELSAPIGRVNPEKPDVPLNKNDAFQKVQKRHVQEKR